MNIKKKTVRIYLLTFVLGGAWWMAVPKLWPGMDSLSNFVSVLVVLPIIVGLAYGVNWAFSEDSKN